MNLGWKALIPLSLDKYGDNGGGDLLLNSDHKVNMYHRKTGYRE